MLRLLHGLFLGHVYHRNPDGDCFECRCGEHWFPGFGLGSGPTRRDAFARYRA